MAIALAKGFKNESFRQVITDQTSVLILLKSLTRQGLYHLPPTPIPFLPMIACSFYVPDVPKIVRNPVKTSKNSR